MNKVILTGNICKDVEIRRTNTGKAVFTNCIAVRRDFKEGEDYQSDFINFVVWGAQAEYVANYGKKGDRVEIVGRWCVRKYDKDDGTQGTANECIVEKINVFSKRPTSKDEPIQEPTDVAVEDLDPNDLPF